MVSVKQVAEYFGVNETTVREGIRNRIDPFPEFSFALKRNERTTYVIMPKLWEEYKEKHEWNTRETLIITDFDLSKSQKLYADVDAATEKLLKETTTTISSF